MRAGSAGGTKRGREGEPIPRRCRAEFMFSPPSCPTAAVTCGTAMTAYELSKLLSRPLGKETLVVLALTTFFVYSVRWTDSDGQSHAGPAAALAERMGRGVGRGAAAAGHPRKLGGEPFRRHRPGPGDPPLRCHRQALPPLFRGAPGGMGGLPGRCQGILSAFCPAEKHHLPHEASSRKVVLFCRGRGRGQDSMCRPRNPAMVWARVRSASPTSRASFLHRKTTQPSTSPSERMGAAVEMT